MKKSYFKQFWVAFKIWVIALVVNALLGSLYIEGELDKLLICTGLIFGCIFSFPIFCIVLIVIADCISRKLNGLQLFRYVLIAGLLFTLLSSVIFSLLISSTVQSGLMVISLLSCIAGVTAQYAALFRLTDYDKKLEKFLL